MTKPRRTLLTEAGDVRTAIVMAKRGVSRDEAHELLLGAAAEALERLLNGKTPDRRRCPARRRNPRQRIEERGACRFLAACVLTDEPITLHRIPRVRDIRTMEKLMTHVGVTMTKEPNGPHHIQCDNLAEPTAPYDLVKTMRASSLVLGPLVARCGRARVSMPGGCAIGARPINLACRGAGAARAPRFIRSMGISKRSPPMDLKGGLVVLRSHHRHRH